MTIAILKKGVFNTLDDQMVRRANKAYKLLTEEKLLYCPDQLVWIK